LARFSGKKNLGVLIESAKGSNFVSQFSLFL